MTGNEQMHLLREPYSKGKYVARPEVDEVLERIKYDRGNTKRRTAQVQVFQGTKGVGKSWLALYLHREWGPSENFQTFLLSFDRESQPNLDSDQNAFCLGDGDQGQDVDSILRWLLSKLSSRTIPKNATLHELRSWFARDGKASPHPLLFIVDGLYEADREFLRKLESHILRSIVEWPQAVLIMMAQGHDVTWDTPELRPRDKRCHLLPFRDLSVYKQIALQEPVALRFAPLIEAFSGGAPLNILFLARFAAITAADDVRISEAQWSAALDELVSLLLDESKASHLRQHLETLSILDGFREDISQVLWTEYQSANNIFPISTFPEWETFGSSGLVRWRRDPNGKNGRYRIDESVRSPIEWQLFLDSLRLWARLHCRALREFQNRTKEARKRSEQHYAELAQYHDAAIGSLMYCDALLQAKPESMGNIEPIQVSSQKARFLREHLIVPADEDMSNKDQESNPNSGDHKSVDE